MYWPLSLLTTVVVTDEPSFLALTSTPSIKPSSAEETCPLSVACAEAPIASGIASTQARLIELKSALSRMVASRDDFDACWHIPLQRDRGALPQPRLLHERIDLALEPAHVVDVAREVEQRAVETHPRQRLQCIDDLLRRADDRIAAPAGDDRFLQLAPPRLRQSLGIGDHRLDQVGHRLPVAVLIDVIVEIILRLLLGLALHDIGVAPDLDLAAVFLAREVAVGVDLGLALREIVAAEHDIDHVAVFRREMLALGRAAGVH